MLANVASAVGRGLLAGVAGTAAMTVSATLEARLTGRGASTVPADAVVAATGVEISDGDRKQRLNTLAHWGYGVAMGGVRGLLGAAGLSGSLAGAAHYGALWVGQQRVLPALGVSAPTWRYGAQAVAIDVTHHAVYAAATSVAYEWLARRSS